MAHFGKQWNARTSTERNWYILTNIYLISGCLFYLITVWSTLVFRSNPFTCSIHFWWEVDFKWMPSHPVNVISPSAFRAMGVPCTHHINRRAGQTNRIMPSHPGCIAHPHPHISQGQMDKPLPASILMSFEFRLRNATHIAYTDCWGREGRGSQIWGQRSRTSADCAWDMELETEE